MPVWSRKEVDALKAKMRRNFKENPGVSEPEPNRASANYLEFKKTFRPKHLSFYEKLCNFSEGVIKIKPDVKGRPKVEEQIRICHLNATPEGVTSFAYIAPVLISIVGIGASYMLVPNIFIMFLFYFVVMGMFMISILLKLPEFFANTWRLKSSNQMVQSIFYVVTYMRHTSNLELAINFASEHIPPPLSLDLKKVLWDLETQKYGTIKESLDVYLEGWRKYNMEFIESFHLIEGSLYETSEDRRLGLIERALSTMLEETYEKMLHYSHDLKGPITLLYMFGVILPILGLVILPMVANFLTDENLTPMILALLIAAMYNVALPMLIYYKGKMILSNRPTGYGDTDITEINPELKKYRNVVFKILGGEVRLSPLIFSGILLFVFVLIGILPIWMHAVIPNFSDPDFSKYIGLELNLKLFDYRPAIRDPNTILGPYGLLATMLSVFLVFGVGLSVGTYYKLRSGYLIKLRDRAKDLEQEFSGALFQLGNRLGDGLPAEIAFGKVASMMRETTSGQFMETVSLNITRLGLSLEKAIFDPKVGAILFFPSTIIESSMKVLIESTKKGPIIASQALINVSDYIKQIHRVNERVKDLLADLLSDMKQQVAVLAPAIAGIVVGVTSMIVLIILRLSESLDELGSSVGSNPGSTSQIVTIFGDPIPTYFFQLIVGIYILQVIYILTIITNGIENGSDSLGEYNALGDNLIRGATLYCVITIVVIFIFSVLATGILSAVGPA